MADKDQVRDQLRQAIQELSDDPLIVIGYLEHQIDVLSKLVHLLVNELSDSGSELSEELLALAQTHEGFIDNSSIDFDDLDNPLQSYKIPKAIEKKARARVIQTRYLNRQIDEGIF